MRKMIGLFAIIIGILIVGIVWYLHSPFASTTRIFSSYALLTSSWEEYKKTFINKDGRVVDPSQNDITTSEGQSYALLRSVWIDDKPTFDFVWKWTKGNMMLRNNLFGWQWGKKPDGTYGFLQNGGNNTAADADSDIAFSLILASRRWNDPKYAAQAQKILRSLWVLETARANGKRYLVAGTWAITPTTLTINPSYFAPYEWRVFAQVDKTRDWNSLISPAYALLQKSSTSPLDKTTAVGLPPDWIQMNTLTGDISPSSNGNFKTTYAFDAMRIPWRIALDYQWNHDPQAKNYLQNFSFLDKEYAANTKLAGTYSHDGTPIQNQEIPSMYATILGYFSLFNPRHAQQIYDEKIIKLYSSDANTFDKNLGYYDQNWLWFGAALYNNFLSSY